MKNLFCLLALSFILVTFNSCKKDLVVKDSNSKIEVINSSNLKSMAAIVSAYDNFYDGIDWSFTNSPSIPSSPASWTLCGYSSNSRWGRLSWNWATCPLYPSLASTSNSNLKLQVPGNLQKKGTQIETVRQDYWYGSYRSKIKAGAHSGNQLGSNPQGTVNGFFYYNSATEQEIDVEILTNEHQSKKVHFVTHPGNYNITYTLGSDPTSTFIEYGFDWYVNKVDFFVNGVKVASQPNGVPSAKGKIILNHWTGNPVWGGNPPPTVSNMNVDYVWHAPFLLVTNPDLAGVVWAKGTTKTITWNKYGDASAHAVKIELWKNGALYQTINNAAPNTGTYSWTIPGNMPTANHYQIKIKSNLNSNYFDLSNNGFTIQ
jgi:hypothetical protein